MLATKRSAQLQGRSGKNDDATAFRVGGSVGHEPRVETQRPLNAFQPWADMTQPRWGADGRRKMGDGRWEMGDEEV